MMLLALAHVWMAAAAGVTLPLVWPDGLGLDARWTLPLVGLVGCFMAAQAALLTALRSVDASRIAPLLGLKIAALAVLATLRGETLGVYQWSAVGLAVAGGAVLGHAGGPLPRRALTQVLAACGLYAVCDELILRTIRGVEAAAGLDAMATPWRGPVFTVAAVYVALALPAAALLPWRGSRRWVDWRDAVPYAVLWLAAMATLYGTFARVGTVLGGILQSSRGLIAIGLGVALSAAGLGTPGAKNPRGGGGPAGHRRRGDGGRGVALSEVTAEVIGPGAIGPRDR